MSEPLAEARVLIVPDLTAFSASLKTQLAAQIKAVEGSSVATSQRAVATRAAAKADEQAAGAAVNTTVALKEKAAADRLAAKAALEHAAAQETLIRGVSTEALASFGLRGATLAASAPFLVGAAAATVAVKSIHEYSAETEAAARVTAILGSELGRSSEEWAKQQTAIGLSAEAALKYQGAIAQVFRNVKIASDENAQFSQNLVTRAVDVAARSNVPVTSVLRAFQLALSGNLRGLRQYVPAVDAATIANRALADTGKTVKADLTTQELVLARYEILMKASANQAGAFADRQGSLATQSKILESNLANLGATLGSAVLPVVGPLVELTSHLAENLKKLSEASNDSTGSSHHQSAATKILNAALKETDREYGFLIAFTKRTDKAVADVSASFGFQTGLAKRLASGTASLSEQEAVLAARVREGGSAGAIAANQLLIMDAAAHQLAGGLNVAASSAAALINVLSALGGQVASVLGGTLAGVNEAVVLKQIQGGSLSAVLKAQQAAVAVAQGAAAGAILGAIGADPTTKAGAAAIKARVDAENAAKSAVDAVAGTKAAIAAGAKKGAAAGAKAAKSAQDLLDQQDQELLAAQQLAQGQSDIAKARADSTKSLVDDVAALRADAALTARQIVEALKIHDANTRLTTIQQLTLKLIQDQADIEEKQAEIRANRRQRLLDRADARVQLADLDAQIAEVRGNKKAQIRALQRENIALEAERKLWIGNRVKQKEITLEIARNTAQIKELRKEKDKNKDAGASLAFQFLQTQQGFAANLLSNLLPTSAVAGTVGGGAISTATTAPFVGNPLPPPGTGFPGGISGDVSSSAQISAGARGASAGQMSTLIHIQRLMLAHIAGGSQRTAHPEAARNWAYSATEMLNTGW